MNILVDELPTAVEVAGIWYPIRSDFKPCIRITLAYEDDDLADYEKQLIMLRTFYSDKIPEDISEALKSAGQFLSGPTVDGNEYESPMRLYSLSKDADFVFAAFRQTHGIDLETAKLHWWKFLALFMDLGVDTTFCSLVSLRKRVKTGKASKEEKEMAHDLGSLFDVPEPDIRTLEDRLREEEFMSKLKEG